MQRKGEEMNTDEREERICLVADGCNISYDEAEKKVDGWIRNATDNNKCQPNYPWED